jgi:hypothetical protein
LPLRGGCMVAIVSCASFGPRPPGLPVSNGPGAVSLSPIFCRLWSAGCALGRLRTDGRSGYCARSLETVSEAGYALPRRQRLEAMDAITGGNTRSSTFLLKRSRWTSLPTCATASTPDRTFRRLVSDGESSAPGLARRLNQVPRCYSADTVATRYLLRFISGGGRAKLDAVCGICSQAGSSRGFLVAEPILAGRPGDVEKSSPTGRLTPSTAGRSAEKISLHFLDWRWFFHPPCRMSHDFRR